MITINTNFIFRFASTDAPTFGGIAQQPSSPTFGSVTQQEQPGFGNTYQQPEFGRKYKDLTESRGRVVTLWPGSQEVWGLIPVATKVVRCKNLAFNMGECVSRGSDTT